MTEKELRTMSNEYNAATALTMGYQEIRNSAENWRTLMGRIASGQAKDLSDEPKKGLQPCIVTGSGPSLDEAIPKLKDWKGGVVAHYSQAVTLAVYGIIPDYIVALDSVCNWEGLRAVDWSKTKTKLILHPGMWPSLVENWPNEMLLYRQNLGTPEGFGTNEQKIMYAIRHGTLQDALDSKVNFEPLIKTEVMMFACTPPAQIAVCNLLQYGPVFLAGLDFAYQGDKERFSNFDVLDGKLVQYVHKLPEREYVRTNNGLKTDPLHLYYKKNFLSACRLSMQRVFTTDRGAITEEEMPYAPLDKVIETQGNSRKWDIPPEIRKLKYERYLAGINCFVIDFGNGKLMFVEVKNPIPDIESFMVGKNKEYICGVCGNLCHFLDAKDHTGDVCAKCNKPNLKRANNIDVEGNMKRIKSLISHAEAK